MQAETWARNLHDDQPEKGPPVLVDFTVDRDELAALDCLAFVRGDPDAYDFWSLVASCRSGVLPHGRRTIAPPRFAPYDIVVGPVSLRWQTRKVLADGDQMSFHTDKAVAVLQKRKPGVIRC